MDADDCWACFVCHCGMCVCVRGGGQRMCVCEDMCRWLERLPLVLRMGDLREE